MGQGISAYCLNTRKTPRYIEENISFLDLQEDIHLKIVSYLDIRLIAQLKNSNRTMRDLVDKLPLSTLQEVNRNNYSQANGVLYRNSENHIVGLKNKKDFQHGNTLLITTVQDDNLQAVSALVDAGAEVNAENDNGQTALILAIEKRDKAMVSELLKAKEININLEGGSSRYTPLMQAVAMLDTEMVKKLIKVTGIDVNLKSIDNSTTALILAAQFGEIELIKVLLEATGIDVNLSEERGFTALMKASLKGHTESVRALIDAGADVTLTSVHGHTALSLAKINNHKEIINLLDVALESTED